MGNDMSIAAIAVPADHTEPPDFAKGRRQLDEIGDVTLFAFDDPSDIETEIRTLLPDLACGTPIVDKNGEPLLEIARRAGLAIIESLEEALASREITSIMVAGYEVYVSGGLSSGDPSETADQIWNAYKLPDPVLLAMGFVPDYSTPLARRNGSSGPVTDTDIVDAIALGLGTKSIRSCADEIEWITDAIAKVRPHPGDTEPGAYLQEFIKRYTFDPRTSDFLAQYVNDEAAGEDGGE